MSQLFGKRPDLYLPGGEWPTYYKKAKGIEVSAVATSVLAGNKTFNEKVQALYDAMLSLKQEFKNCATIRELNVLWQKYMGVPMPYSQMVEEGIAEEGGIPPVIPAGLQF